MVAELRPGQRFGAYQILGELGRGGMGVVYRAHDTRLQRTVALKVLPAQGDPERKARFEREARVAAQLQHPGIVRVYDYGLAEGLAYLVLEYADGGSVADLLARSGGKLDLEQAARITRQVAAALAYAHGRQVVHRDLKPSNVLLTRDGRVLLGDFGIARMSRGMTLTATGVLVGTPAYMSPEQALGNRRLDGRSDVYGLGVLLFQMLTGALPFQRDSVLATVRAVVDDPPPRPTALERGISPAVERVILRALEKDPARRFQTAGAMATALDAALARVAPKGRGQAPGPATTGLLLAGAAALVVVLALVAIALVAGLTNGTPTPQSTTTEIAVTDLAAVSAVPTGGSPEVARTPVPSAVTPGTDMVQTGTPTPWSTPPETEWWVEGTVIDQSGAGFRVRDKPTTNSRQVGSLWDGDKVQVYCKIGNSGEWYDIGFGNVQRGYVFAPYIQLADGVQPGDVPACEGSEGSETVAEMIPTGTPTRTATHTPTATRTPRGKPKKPPTATPYPTPQPQLPAFGAEITDQDTIILEWHWDGKLEANQHFDVRVWREGQKEEGVAWTKDTRYDLYLPAQKERLIVPDMQGVYYWRIVVVQGTGGVWEKDMAVGEVSQFTVSTSAPVPPTSTPRPSPTPEFRPGEG